MKQIPGDVVTICAWCPGAHERMIKVIAQGKMTSHGICPSCKARMDDELDRRPMMPQVTLLPTQKQFAALMWSLAALGVFWIGLLIYLMRTK